MVSSRALLVLYSDAMREKAIDWIRKAPKETRVTFQGPKRTLDQNAALWAKLTDIAHQKLYHGIRLGADDFKLLFLDALKREVRMVPNLDGTGLVSLGRSSSNLSKDEMNDLLTLITSWGDQNGVVFHGPEDGP